MTIIDHHLSQGFNAQERADLLARLRDGRLRAAGWLSDRIDDDGRPAGAETSNSWWRAPWGLCVGGDSAAAARLMGWIERNALTDNGDLRPPPYGPNPGTSPVYWLAPIAIAAWLLARYDTANLVMDRLQYWTDQETGGAYEYSDFTSDPLQHNLKTSALGVAALVTGRREAAENSFRWLADNYALQAGLPNEFYTSRRNGELVTDFKASEAYDRLVDYRIPHQAFVESGIAGAFLAGYASQTGDLDARDLGLKYLDLNKSGTDVQWTDKGAVQICKFGWGVAAMHVAAPDSGQLPWVIKSAEWFLDRQEADGSWAPSIFHAPEPNELDYYWKTSEHLMELSYIEQSLSASTANN